MEEKRGLPKYFIGMPVEDVRKKAFFAYMRMKKTPWTSHDRPSVRMFFEPLDRPESYLKRPGKWKKTRNGSE